MKKTLLTLTALLCILGARAQFSDSAKYSKEHIFTLVEQDPEFPGGNNELYRFFGRTIHYPEAAREHNMQGRVVVLMVVEKDGSLSQVKVARGIGGGCDEEAVRVVKLSSPWKPGMQNGKAVRVAYSVPISFRLGNL